MYRTFPLIFLSIAFVLAAVAYSLGLSGGFVFDDYPQIVINDNLRSVATLTDISRVVVSGNAGPGGRPLALLTFAAQIGWTGLDPYWFKLVNVAIHLFNGLLVYSLIGSLLRAWKCFEGRQGLSEPSQLVASLVTGWWLLAPLGLTSVLYVVQRMNSLSAMFCLAGLWGYVHFRRKGLEVGHYNFVAIFWATFFTALSYYSKETGLLTLAFAWLIESYAFHWVSLTPRWRKIFSFLKFAPVYGLALAVAVILAKPEMIEHAGRAFSLSERLLTQTRVLWFHLGQLVVPNASTFSVYHDDFVVSTGLLSPISTVSSFIAHAILIGLACLLRKKFAIFSFGVAWFYVGHLLESTIFPLEMVFEHRNYLPMIGPILAIVALSIEFSIKHLQYRQLVVAGLVLWIGVSGLVLASRTHAWGDPLYPIQEAERKPASSRANYDAGIALLNAVSDDQEWNEELFQLGRRYFDRSVANEENGIASLIGLAHLHVRVGKRPDEDILKEAERRLSVGIPHINLMFSVLSIHKLMAQDTPFFTDDDAERLYIALLSNPRVRGLIRSHGLTAYGLLKGKQGDGEAGIGLLKAAVHETPHINEFRVIYIAALIDLQLKELARTELEQLRLRDRFGVFELEASALATKLAL